MSEKRRDNKNRVLRNGEVQLSDGRYRYKYIDIDCEEKYVYSWKLVKTDKVPAGKRDCESLREKEDRILDDLKDGISTTNKNVTVSEIIEKYLATKPNIRETTRRNYESSIKGAFTDNNFDKRKIESIKMSDAKKFMIDQQKGRGVKTGTLSLLHGLLKGAFDMAVNDDLIRKNPFKFCLCDVLGKDESGRAALTPEQEDSLLNYIKTHKKYKKYYEAVYILLNTGLRISEFCGLTLNDIDFESHTINIDHQIKYRQGRYTIEPPKSESSIRKIPMTADIESKFKSMIRNRIRPKVEPTVDGLSGFLWLSKNRNPSYCCAWDGVFRAIHKRYNAEHDDKIPDLTPHICRHTFCTKMVREGMAIKVLQYLMGHSTVQITMDTYTHVNYEYVTKEYNSIMKNIS